MSVGIREETAAIAEIIIKSDQACRSTLSFQQHSFFFLKKKQETVNIRRLDDSARFAHVGYTDIAR